MLIRNYSGSPSWIPGTVKTVLGPVSYQVELKDGRLWKRHLDQLLKDHSPHSDDSINDSIVDFSLSEPALPPSATVENPPVRRSTRVRRPPDKLTM